MSNVEFRRALQAQGQRIQVVALSDGEPVAAANLPLGDLAAWEAGVWASYGRDVRDVLEHKRTPGGLYL